ncbi:MAG TPA: ribonuclease H [Phaeodactylibacter sp.]|nr:ribonuclease H [Phaeodactylibacter sp.]
MAKKKKYYVIWDGNETGVFDSWAKCQVHIKGYPNAKYKSFPTKEEAEKAYRMGAAADFIGKNKKTTTKKISEAAREKIVWKSIAVDAACSGNPGNMEYRGVDTQTGFQYFHQGPFKKGTNNVGEFLALVHALAWLQREGKPDLPIYSDSRIAIGWVKKKRANTKLEKTAANAILFQLLQRAETWLKNNTYSNPILKWETKEWGEIPADFGRK